MGKKTKRPKPLLHRCSRVSSTAVLKTKQKKSGHVVHLGSFPLFFAVGMAFLEWAHSGGVELFLRPTMKDLFSGILISISVLHSPLFSCKKLSRRGQKGK